MSSNCCILFAHQTLIDVLLTLFLPVIRSVSFSISCRISSKSTNTLFFTCKNMPHSSASLGTFLNKKRKATIEKELKQNFHNFTTAQKPLYRFRRCPLARLRNSYTLCCCSLACILAVIWVAVWSLFRCRVAKNRDQLDSLRRSFCRSSMKKREIKKKKKRKKWRIILIKQKQKENFEF
jgi:hypothetical protein